VKSYLFLTYHAKKRRGRLPAPAAAPATPFFVGDTQASRVSPASTTLNMTVGSPYEGKVEWDAENRYNVISGPVGITIGNETGTIRWTPTPDQAGEHQLVITDGTDQHTFTLNVADAAIAEDLEAAGWLAPDGLKNGDGTYVAATKTFDYSNTFRTFRTDSKNGDFTSTVRTIYLRGGVYLYDAAKNPYGTRINVEDPLVEGVDECPTMKIFAPDGELLVIKPWGNERVMFRGGLTGTMFRTDATVKNVRFEGIEWRGESKFATHEEVIKSWWQELPRYNGNGIAIGGSKIEFRNCVLHECMSQTMACKDSSNIVIKDCIVANAARWTISGTTGIGFVNMKGSDDDPSTHSNIVDGCLIFGIESYLYSHVFSKGATHLTLDEGEGLLAQPANQASDTSDQYMGRTLFKNTALMHCGKGIVINGQPRCDIIDCTIYETGTTITGTSKAMRNNKSTDNRWIRCAVNTVKGSGGRYGEAARFGEPAVWDNNTSYSKEGGGFLFAVPDDGNTYATADNDVLEAGKTYLLNYKQNRNKNDTPETIDVAEVALMVLRGEWIAPYLEDCFASNNEYKDDGPSGITYVPNVFRELQSTTIALSDDVKDHADYPAAGVGANETHITKLIDRARSYSVDLSIPTHWKWLRDVDEATGLTGYQTQTKQIMEQAEALGLTIDYSHWHNTLPYTDDQGVEHAEFHVTVTGGTTPLEDITAVNGQTELELTVVHTYPRRGTAKNLLPYAPTDGEKGAYYSSNLNLTGTELLTDGNDITTGVIKSGGTAGRFYMVLTLEDAAYLNEIRFSIGQPNGEFSFSSAVEVYQGSILEGDETLLDTLAIAQQSRGLQTIDLLGNSAFDTPSRRFSLVWVGTGNNVGLLELELYGEYAAEQAAPARPSDKFLLPGYNLADGEAGYVYKDDITPQNSDRLSDVLYAETIEKESGGSNGELHLIANFPTPVYLNEIGIGGVPGSTVQPNYIELYRGDAVDPAQFIGVLPITQAGAFVDLQDLSNSPRLDTASDRYLLRAIKTRYDTDGIQLSELEFYGRQEAASTRPTDLDPLTFAVSNTDPDATYFSGNGIERIIDGNETTTGVIRNSTGGIVGHLFVLMTFDNPVYINELRISFGQFNGFFNEPTDFLIYRGNTATLANLIGKYPVTATDRGFVSFSQIGNAAFDTPSNEYLVVFRHQTFTGVFQGLIAVLEMQALGAIA
jgi:hypothetical protein